MSAGRPLLRITRRTALAGAAAAGAASIVSPAVGLADAVDQRRAVFSRTIGTLNGESGALAAPRRFSLVGVQWAGPGRPTIELRTRSADGVWSPWVLASVLGHGPDGPTRRTVQIGEGIWTGPADYVQLRSPHTVHGVRLHFVSAALPDAVHAGAEAAAALPLAQPVLDAGPGPPAIIARSAWADGAKPKVSPAYGIVHLAFVHHTENPNGYSAAEVPAMLLAIYQFHRFVRGWNDIGYNFVIDAFGRIWEARAGGIDQAVIGAQAGGYNAVSTGAAVLGSFMDVVPSPAAIDALQRLLAWKLSLHGIPAQGHVTVEVSPADAFYTPFAPGAHVSLPRVAGHRDGDATSCPGDAFYARLPAIRANVAQLAGSPVKLTISASKTAAAAPATIGVSGRATMLSGGAPLAGAPLVLQQLTAAGEHTIASLTTEADGSWNTSLTLDHSLLVRALHVDAPASASDLLYLAVAPVIELSIDSKRPLKVSGTVMPPSRTVTIEVFSLRNGHRALALHKRVPVRQGRFVATLAIRRRGSYAVSAATRATVGNAAALSQPLAVKL
jgi:hypothetical protein